MAAQLVLMGLLFQIIKQTCANQILDHCLNMVDHVQTMVETWSRNMGLPCFKHQRQMATIVRTWFDHGSHLTSMVKTLSTMFRNAIGFEFDHGLTMVDHVQSNRF